VRNWKDFWNKIAANNENLYQQVARTSKDNKPINEEVLDLIAEHIKNKLDLRTTDILIDVCCGNGLITQRILSDCEKIIGIDISEILINNATKHCAGSNIYYIEADALGGVDVVDRLAVVPGLLEVHEEGGRCKSRRGQAKCQCEGGELHRMNSRA